MNKLINYIKDGSGYGLIFILASATICTLFFVLSFKTITPKIEKQINNIAQEVLPIVVENNQIVSPTNLKKEYKLDIDKNNLYTISINTESTDNNEASFNNGILIQKNEVLFKINNEVTKLNLTDGQYNYEDFIKKVDEVLNISSIILSVVTILTLFILFSLKSIIITLASKLYLYFTKNNKAFNFSLNMRLSSILISLLEILIFLCAFAFSFNPTFIEVCIISIIIEIYILHNNKLAL